MADVIPQVLVVQRFIAAALAAFEARFLADVRALQPTLADMTSEKVDPAKVSAFVLLPFRVILYSHLGYALVLSQKAKPEDILRRFTPFEQEADSLRKP